MAIVDDFADIARRLNRKPEPLAAFTFECQDCKQRLPVDELKVHRHADGSYCTHAWAIDQAGNVIGIAPHRSLKGMNSSRPSAR